MCPLTKGIPAQTTDDSCLQYNNPTCNIKWSLTHYCSLWDVIGHLVQTAVSCICCCYYCYSRSHGGGGGGDIFISLYIIHQNNNASSLNFLFYWKNNPLFIQPWSCNTYIETKSTYTQNMLDRQSSGKYKMELFILSIQNSHTTHSGDHA